MYRPFLEQLVAFATEQTPPDTLQQTRQIFFTKIGEASEEDPSFEARLASFGEWYALDFQDSSKLRWVDHYAKMLSHELLPYAKQIASSQHSLFGVLQPEPLLIEDLWGGGRFHIQGELPPGLRKQDIFEGRVIPWGDKLYLSQTLMFHPIEARSIILQQVSTDRALRQPCRETLARLARMRLRFDRYRKIPLERIYDPNAIFGH